MKPAGEFELKMGRVEERPVWALYAGMLFRALHQVGAAVYLTVFLLADTSGLPTFYLVLAFASGGCLLAVEFWRHRQLYREVAGLVTIVKLLLFGLAWHGFLPAAGTVLCAFLIASVGAHASKRIRHRLLL